MPLDNKPWSEPLLNNIFDTIGVTDTSMTKGVMS